MRKRWVGRSAALAAGVCICWGGAQASVEVAALPDDLTELSLDDLMQVEIVSVSRKAEPLQLAAAAVFVVTGDDIRRSGARNIAEALRLVPGLHVARNGATDYAISARGFNSGSADKMEVLLDGRSVYTPLFSGVFWDTLDTYLGDIDRIEVIRGPGATLWGANAVNGVINIVTRHAGQTLGSEVNLSAGNEQQAAGALRAGRAVGAAGGVRFYAKAHELDDSVDGQGRDQRDSQRFQQAGLRGDFHLGAVELGVTADRYDSRTNVTTVGSETPAVETASGNHLMLRGRWNLNEQQALSGQAYLDQYQRFSPSIFSEDRQTVDLQLQYQTRLGRHQFNAGLGFRETEDETGGPPLLIIWEPANRTARTRSAFIQDQIGFWDRRLVWTVGTKFERNDYTGDELQPGTRLGYQISEQVFTWAAVSRAVRTPNRLDHDTALFCDAVVIQPLLGCTVGSRVPFGSRDFDSEKLLAWEWGLRLTDQQRYSADLALFYNDYDDIKTQEGAGFGSQANNGLVQTYGAELALNWRLRSGLDLRAHYSWLHVDAQTRAGSVDPNFQEREHTDPEHQASLRVLWNPAGRWHTDATLRYVGGFDQYSGTAPNPRVRSRVPAYVELNSRVAWRYSGNSELALVGENLLDSSHPEFGPADTRSEAERALRLEWIWSW